jgi:hypothetical protein
MRPLMPINNVEDGMQQQQQQQSCYFKSTGGHLNAWDNLRIIKLLA